jgi:hypothetical protein
LYNLKFLGKIWAKNPSELQNDGRFTPDRLRAACCGLPTTNPVALAYGDYGPGRLAYGDHGRRVFLIPIFAIRQ